MSEQNPNQPPNAGGWQDVNTNPPPAQGYSAPPPPPPNYQPQSPYVAQRPLAPTTAAMIAYLTFIGAVIMLVMDPYRRNGFVRFHAWQCLVLTGVWIAGDVVFGALSHIAMHLLMVLLLFVFHIILFIFWLVAVIKAGQGEAYHVPVVGDAADHLAATVQG